MRKHQKYFFVIVTVAIVASFCFFGTYGALDQGEADLDSEVVMGIAHVPLMRSEIAALSLLLESSSLDRGRQEMPNLLNDGVVEKDFLSTGLASVLVEKYFADLQKDLEPRMQKIGAFTPYVHPFAPQISAEKGWSRFSPALLEHLNQLKSDQSGLSPKHFALMSQLYIDQIMLPPDMLKQLLTMQQNQMGATVDPSLAYHDLNLFGFKSMNDWFGPQFISLVAQVILNAAQLAEEKGCKIETAQVRSELYQNIYKGYEQLGENKSLSSEEAQHYFYGKIRSLGLTEKVVLHAWKKVMLFRKLFEEGATSVLVDPLAYQQFAAYAKQSARIKLYQLPEHLRFSDFRSMLQFQVYLEAVAPNPLPLRTELDLPEEMASLEQIEKRAPELVYHPISIEWSMVDAQELSKSISIKQTRQWEVGDSGWEFIQGRFSEMRSVVAADEKERLDALKNVKEALRSSIDQAARCKMMQDRSAEIELALQAASVNSATLHLKSQGTLFPFPGIKEGAELQRLLEEEKSEELHHYCPDGQHHYRIRVVQHDREKKLLTFAQSLQDGTLGRLLDRHLESNYSEVRIKTPALFQQSNGQWRPFKEVKDQVAKAVFAHLMKTIETTYRKEFGFLPGKEGELPLSFYSNARLLGFMKRAEKRLQKNETGFVTQWLLDESESVIERCKTTPFSKEEMFELKPNEWSPVKIGERGALCFYCMQEQIADKPSAFEEVGKAQQHLVVDVKLDMMAHLIDEIQKSNAVHFSDSTLLIEGSDLGKELPING